MIKIDHTFGPKLALNGKFLHDSNPTLEQGGLFRTLSIPGILTTFTNSPGHQYSISAIYTPTPTLIIDGGYRYSYGAILSDVIGAVNVSQSPHIQSAIGSTLPFANVVGRVPSLTFTGGTFTNAGGSSVDRQSTRLKSSYANNSY